MAGPREGNLEAPTRHSIDWQDPAFYDPAALQQEMERVFGICHGCRRCVNLCQAFPTLFDLIDESASMEADGVDKADYGKVVEHCYLCDLCYMTKCPYVPPHEWNLDFPHLMLRAKAVQHRQGRSKLRDKVLTSTDAVGSFCGIPIVAQAVNAANGVKPLRKLLHKLVGIHSEAWLPRFHSRPLRSRLKKLPPQPPAAPTERTTGKVALFATCYMNRNEPGPGEDLAAVFRHNGIVLAIAEKESCCGMPKLELGDLDAVLALKERNIPTLARLVDAGWDLTALVPSCVLMFKQELPLLFPGDPDVQKVKEAFFDPFEYLMLRHRAGLLKTDFNCALGTVTLHSACHQRVQNIGPKTRECLELIPGTTVEAVERCSGHDGTYAVKAEYHAYAMKIARPVVGAVRKAAPDHFGSDCAMAGHHIAHAHGAGLEAEHPITLLRKAYGI